MKKGSVAATSHKKDTGGASTSAQPTRSDAPMSKAEIKAIVEKTVSDALAQQMPNFQTEVTKSTKQQLQDLSNRLLEFGDKSLDDNSRNLNHFQQVDDTLRDLHQRCVMLEKLVNEELHGIVEKKVQLVLRKIHPELEVEKETGKWSEQLACHESAHQQEIQKLHQQHHQDMLSVINDCCRKLKSSFTRQHKPYEVDEVHAVIDDVEQKMIREILSEIEKTEAHGDLSSFEEALVTSKVSGEVSKGKEFTRLTSDEITASLNAFESENLDIFSKELENAAAAAAEEDERKPVAEENISFSKAMITGDRGNIYYQEELKRTVDDMITTEEKTGANPKEGQSGPDLPPKTGNYQDVEESLESLIISGDAESCSFEEDMKSLISKDAEDKEKAVADDAKLGGQGKKREILPETSSHDPDRLKSLEAMVEGDISWAELLPPSKGDPDQSKSHKVVTDPFTTPATSTRDQGVAKSLEGKVESNTSAPAIPPRDLDKLKSLEGKLEPKPGAKSVQDQAKPHEVPATSIRDQDLVKSLEGKLEPKPGAKSVQDQAKPREVPATPIRDQDLVKSLEGMLESDTSAPALSPRDLDKLKSLEGKLEPEPSAELAQDLDRMKSLEAMLEAQMTDNLDTDGSNISHEHIEPTKSAGQQVKDSLSDQVTASAFQPTETMNVAPRTGFGENPHYVEEVIHAAQSTGKEKP